MIFYHYISFILKIYLTVDFSTIKANRAKVRDAKLKGLITEKAVNGSQIPKGEFFHAQIVGCGDTKHRITV